MRFPKELGDDKKQMKRRRGKQGSENTIDETSKAMDSKKPRRACQKAGQRLGDLPISSKEQKELQKALSISLKEKSYNSHDFSKVKKMKEFRPTAAEFKDPVQWIEANFQECRKYGCVKVILPKKLVPKFAFQVKGNKTQIPTRKQVLQNLQRGVPFTANPEGHTVENFMKQAKKFETKYCKKFEGMSDKQKYEQLEQEYFDYVENQMGDDVEVEYAADLPTDIYGSGFFKDEKLSKTEKGRLNFHNLIKSPHSLLAQHEKKNPDKRISGITMPWLYMGMQFSTFCWHFEDLMLYSVNYNHYGEAKIWYAVPENDRKKFEKLAKEKLFGLYQKDSNFLLDIIIQISPAYLAENGVRRSKFNGLDNGVSRNSEAGRDHIHDA